MIKVIFIFFGISFSRDCLIDYNVNDLSRFYSRPTMDTFTESFSGYFYIHYDTLGSAAPNLEDNNNNHIPDYVEEVASIADSAH